jgi:hypothetical protein
MMYEPNKLDLAQMIGEEVSRLRRERDQLKEINDRMAEDRLRLVAELEGWKDNAEDTLRMYDKLKAESNELKGQLAKAADPVNGPVQLSIHRATCDESLTHCSEYRGRCVRSAEAVAWALGLGGEDGQ